MLTLILLLTRIWARDKMADTAWQRQRDREDREIKGRADELLHRAHRRQLRRQLSGDRGPVDWTEPTHKPKKRNPFRTSTPGGSSSTGMVVMMVLGGIVTLMLLGCGGVTMGLLVMSKLRK